MKAIVHVLSALEENERSASGYTYFTKHFLDDGI
jgi:hypothetical protein